MDWTDTATLASELEDKFDDKFSTAKSDAAKSARSSKPSDADVDDDVFDSYCAEAGIEFKASEVQSLFQTIAQSAVDAHDEQKEKRKSGSTSASEASPEYSVDVDMSMDIEYKDKDGMKVIDRKNSKVTCSATLNIDPYGSQESASSGYDLSNMVAGSGPYDSD